MSEGRALSQNGHKEPEVFDEDLLETRVGVHDSNHFEVKLDYAIEAHRTTRYFVDTYLFVPLSLGINPHTYRAAQFYRDIQAYIRFKTPRMSLRDVVDATNPRSPIAQIASMVRRVQTAPRDVALRQKLSYELRIFGCIARANMRDRSRSIRKLLEDAAGAGAHRKVKLGDAHRAWDRLLEDVAFVSQAWRDLRSDFVDRQLPVSIRETFEHVDEYISLATENLMTALIRAHDRAGGEITLGDTRARTRDLIVAEREYRRGAGYQSVVDEEDRDNDHLVYRQGMLKKFVTSVLWLEVTKSVDGKRSADVGAAIAAALAMLFAVLATIKATHWWGINSAPFVIAAVVTYIFKDRIKDWIKTFWSTHVSRVLADYNVKILDPISHESIGKLRESFVYLHPRNVPSQIFDCRHGDAKVSIEAMAKPEVVLKYSKAVILNGKEVVERLHLEDYSLNDIVRFCLSHFLSRADDPKSIVPYYSETADSVKRRRFRKVYHLNVVLALRAESVKARPVIKRVRVIFDKSAIRELQEVPVGRAPRP